MNIMLMSVACCNVEASYKNCCHHSFSAWDGFIETLPCLLMFLFIIVVVLFVIKYGVEYYKIYKQNQKKQSDSVYNTQLQNIKDLLEAMCSAKNQKTNYAIGVDNKIDDELRNKMKILDELIKLNNTLNKKFDINLNETPNIENKE